jgi:hypothetical protein
MIKTYVCKGILWKQFSQKHKLLLTPWKYQVPPLYFLKGEKKPISRPVYQKMKLIEDEHQPNNELF